ncbi:hypothetical protein HDU76_003894 [Blyttiomyces sp. JEL0837]|nr:hypothetical protein HDU76_003894 [Blyttiomyces sp. JEL0837]
MFSRISEWASKRNEAITTAKNQKTATGQPTVDGEENDSFDQDAVFPVLTLRKPRRLTLQDINTPQTPLIFSKESFERVLTEEKLFAEFKEYATNVDHCGENIMFWEGVVELEDLLTESDPTYGHGLQEPATWALSRFLNSPISNLYPIIPVPLTLLPHFLYFHSTFLSNNAPSEVNIQGSLRISIETVVETGKFTSDVFDRAIDEVVSLLYLNTFRGFIASKEKENKEKRKETASLESSSASLAKKTESDNASVKSGTSMGDTPSLEPVSSPSELSVIFPSSPGANTRFPSSPLASRPSSRNGSPPPSMNDISSIPAPPVPSLPPQHKTNNQKSSRPVDQPPPPAQRSQSHGGLTRSSTIGGHTTARKSDDSPRARIPNQKNRSMADMSTNDILAGRPSPSSTSRNNTNDTIVLNQRQLLPPRTASLQPQHAPRMKGGMSGTGLPPAASYQKAAITMMLNVQMESENGTRVTGNQG